MTTAAELTPEQRVQIMVGGHFSRAALGAKYDEILAAFDADPPAHLEAFRRLYLVGPPDRIALTELPLGNVIQRAMRTHPDQAAAAAQVLMERLNRVAQIQESEAIGAATFDETSELDRERLQIERQRDGLALILSRH